MQSAYLQFQLTPKVLLQTLDSDDTLQQPNIYIYNIHIYIDKYRAWASQMTEVSNQEKHYEERSLAAWLSQPLTALSDRGFFSLGNSLWCLLFVWMPFFPPHPCLMSTPNEFSRQHCCFHCQMMFHGQRVFTYMVFTAKCVFTAKWFSRPNGFHGQMGFTATRFFHGLLSKLHLATFFMDKVPPRKCQWKIGSSSRT